MFFVHLSLLLSQSFGEDRSLTNHPDTASHYFVAVDECLCSYGKIHFWLNMILSDFSQTQSLKQQDMSCWLCKFGLTIYFECVFPHEKGQYIRAIFIYSYLMNRKNTDPVLFSIKHISPLNNKIRDLGTSETIPFGASFSKEVIYTQHNALRG